jgi:hypothetical protein
MSGYLNNKNILIISPEPWGITKLSKHHYALALLEKANHVWFLQPPGNYEFHQDIEIPNNLHLLQDTFTFKGARLYPTTIRQWLFRRAVKRMMAFTKTQFDVIWNFDNSRFFDMTCFQNAYRIHHKMDYHYNYQEKLASSTANLCLGVTTEIVAEMKKSNYNAHFIQHGYHPTTPSDYKLPETSEKFKAFYSGNLLLPFINWEWVEALVVKNEDTHFFLAGSYRKGNMNRYADDSSGSKIRELAEHKNVTLLGELNTADLTAALNQADLLFAAYDSNKYPEIVANSHKLMEYFGSGKPIISNEFGEYARLGHLLFMAQTTDTFTDRFNHVKNNLEQYSRLEFKEERIAWALQNTYEKQLQRIDELITLK